VFGASIRVSSDCNWVISTINMRYTNGVWSFNGTLCRLISDGFYN
jgi:hypothetical protein